jgi:hypothetical protein
MGSPRRPPEGEKGLNGAGMNVDQHGWSVKDEYECLGNLI